MMWFKIFWKVIPFLWPFIREMVLGKKSFLAALRDNKKKVFLLLLIVSSFGLNFLTVPRLLSMSVQYVDLDKRYKEAQAKCTPVTSSAKHPSTNGIEQRVQVKDEPAIQTPMVEIKAHRPEKSKRETTLHSDADHIKEQLEKIKRREEAELP